VVVVCVGGGEMQKRFRARGVVEGVERKGGGGGASMEPASVCEWRCSRKDGLGGQGLIGGGPYRMDVQKLECVASRGMLASAVPR